MNQLFWTTVVAGGLLAGIPLMFTALGESISERAGVLNIGLEGMMLVGAYCGYLGAHYGHSVWVGYLTGILGGMSGSAVIMAVLCVRLGLDQIVVGIAITLAGEGITSVLYQNQFSSTQPRPRRQHRAIPIPLLDQIPILGKPLNGQFPLFSQPLARLPRPRLRRAPRLDLPLDEHRPQPARRGREAGGAGRRRRRASSRPGRYAVLSTGALAGLGGAYLSIVGAGGFQPFLTQGQGFMAIVIAMLARGRPLGVVVGSFLFGITISLGTALAGGRRSPTSRTTSSTRSRSSPSSSP